MKVSFRAVGSGCVHGIVVCGAGGGSCKVVLLDVLLVHFQILDTNETFNAHGIEFFQDRFI